MQNYQFIFYFFATVPTLVHSSHVLKVFSRQLGKIAVISVLYPGLDPSYAASQSIRDANILTNPVLETMRIIDQRDMDNISPTKTSTALLLYPIIQLQMKIEDIGSAMKAQDSARLRSQLTELEGSDYQTASLKKIFNRYADNIYYADPDRANLYLGGGAVPDSTQTTKYLLRNDILTKLEDVKLDLLSLTSSGDANIPYSDALSDYEDLARAVQDYIDLSNPSDVELVKKIISNKKSS